MTQEYSSMTAIPEGLTDTHTHLQDARLQPAGPVLERAFLAHVKRMVCCGSTVDDWAGVQALSRQHPEAIIPFFGLHPWYVAEAPPGWFDDLQERLEDPRAGVGEIGLDFALERLDPKAQQEAFARQYALSIEMKRPVSVHCRRAWEPLLETLARHPPHPAGLVLHAYSGSTEWLERYIPFHAYVAFGGSIIRMRPTRAAALLNHVPADRLLFETDAPDLAPPLPPELDDLKRDARGRAINEPAVLPHIIHHAARLMDKDPVALAQQAEANARQWLHNRDTTP